MAPEELTLAEVLKSAGYRTAMFGEWHLGAHRDFRRMKLGFDELFGIRDGFSDNFNHIFLHGTVSHDHYDGTEGVYAVGDYFTELMVQRTLQFLDHNKGRPFYLHVPFNIPHYPEQSLRQFEELYEDRDSVNYSKTINTWPVLLAFMLSLVRADDTVPPAWKTLPFHGIRATDPNGRIGLRNPERGLRFETRIAEPVGQGDHAMPWIRAMQRFEPDGLTLSQTYCYLNGFVDRPISQEKLDYLQRDFDLMRRYGFKCVLRFAYQRGDIKGPEEEWTLRHIEQLKPIIEKNADVIFILQAGFIGMWGEWHGDTHITYNDYDARAAILAKILELVPKDRFTQVRVPKFKRILIPRMEKRPYQEVTEHTAFSLKPEARIGFNNDGVLAGPSHGGTWPEEPHFGRKENPEFARATRESAWTPTEGEMFWSDQAWDEVEETGKGVDGFNAIKYLRLQHYVSFSLAHSYSEFQGKLYCMDRWRNRTVSPERLKAENLPVSDGYFCDAYGQPVERTEFEYLRDHVGYRLELQEVRLTENLKRDESLFVEIDLINRGFSTLINPRQAHLLLISSDEQDIHEIPLDVSPRDWQPFDPEDPNYEPLLHTIRYAGQLPEGITPGKYTLGLWLPDPKLAIRLDPNFAVRVANRRTDWWTTANGQYGVNVLHTIRVGAGEGAASDR